MNFLSFSPKSGFAVDFFFRVLLCFDQQITSDVKCKFLVGGDLIFVLFFGDKSIVCGYAKMFVNNVRGGFGVALKLLLNSLRVQRLLWLELMIGRWCERDLRSQRAKFTINNGEFMWFRIGINFSCWMIRSKEPLRPFANSITQFQ